MAKAKRIGSIEIAQDLDFQRRSWSVQRVGWLVMLALAGFALAGLFGGGPLSSASSGDEKLGFRVRYERFARLSAPQSLYLDVSSALIKPDSTVAVWLSREWLETNQVRQITPEPQSTRVTPNSMEYSFRAAGGANALLTLRFDLETRSMGRRRGSAGVTGGPAAEFNQFAYP
jgi:hypothetical protein